MTCHFTDLSSSSNWLKTPVVQKVDTTSLSTGWCKYMDSLLRIHWIVIYEGDSAIQSLNKWGQKYNPDLGSRNFCAQSPLYLVGTPVVALQNFAVLF